MDIISLNEAATANDRIDILDSTTVKLTENQTIAGVKTFTSSPKVPAPTDNNDVATKKYVDQSATGSIINKPVITSPVNLTVDYIGAVTSTYSTGPFYGGLQTKAIWECALDVNFNNIIDSYEGSSNLTSWTPAIGLALTQVFIRTKQISDGHRSEFSDTVSFATPNIFIRTPTITIGGNLSGLVLTPTISLSAFSVFNGSDIHVSTDYQVVNKATGVIKWESLGNTVDKLGIATGQLDIQTEYTFRARFNGQTYGSSSWVELDGTTVNIYVKNPILTVTGTPNSVTLSPTMSGSAFNVINGVDTHTSTDYRVVKVSDGTVAFESLNNTVDLTSIKVTGLSKITEYKFMIRYNSSVYGSSNWVEVTGTTLNIYVENPTLTVSGAPDNITLTPTLTGSAFSVYNSTDTHVSTDYRVVKVSDNSTVFESLGNTVNLTSIQATGLEKTTGYKFMLRYNSDLYGSSDWIEVVGTTLDTYVVTPTLTVQGQPLDIGKNPTLTTSAFTIYNGTDVHSSTDWKVYDGVTLVWESPADTTNKLSIVVPSGILEVSKTYTFKAKHNGTTYGSSAYAETTGTTKAVFSIEYGLQWNNTADTYTRLGAAASWTTGADFTNNETVQSRMRRCVLNANGTVNYYLSATDSTKRKDGVTAADLTGASGNVMVEIPKFWVKYDNTTSAKQMWISTAPAIGYVVHPWFVKDGVEVDYRYYRAYKGSVSGTKLISRSGVAAAGNETIVSFRTKAQANGTGWGLVDWNSIFAVQTLLFIEIGTFNSQSILGNGNDTGSDYGMTTGGSNSIGNASSPSTNDDTWMSYRGIENFYADIHEWIDGINISERLVYTSNTQSTFASNVFSGAYTSTGVTLPSTNGYISDMNFSIKGFIPTVATGSDSTYVTDYVLSNPGARVAAFGGSAGAGLTCGAAYLIAHYASSSASANFGAGLLF